VRGDAASPGAPSFMTYTRTLDARRRGKSVRPFSFVGDASVPPATIVETPCVCAAARRRFPRRQHIRLQELPMLLQCF
jgi:hypothetical protein